MPRLYIAKQLELSALPYSIIVTDVNKEATYLQAGTNGQVLQIVGGKPTYVTPPIASFTFSDGVNTQLVSAGDTFTYISGNGIKATVSATRLLTLAVKLSTDTGNAATIGSDGGVYIAKDNLLTGVVWDDTTNSMKFTFTNGSIITVPIADLVGNFLSDFKISDGTTTSTIDNHATVTFQSNNLLKRNVTGNIVTYGIDPTGSASGDHIESTGATTSPVWKKPLLSKRDEFDTPALVEGANTVTLLSVPNVLSKTSVYRNGILLLTPAYSIAGAVVTFVDVFSKSVGAIFSESIIVTYQS